MLREGVRFALLTGKGGVGKTTCAAAIALHLAGSGRRTLLVSTDPVHSVADSLGLAVGGEPTPVPGVDGLFACELNAAEQLARFKAANAGLLMQIAARGTYFDREDISDFFSLSLPGIDELMAVIYVIGLLDDRRYDAIVLDTAPTGHTLRLLTVPELMEQWTAVLDHMYEKHRYMALTFTGRYVPDRADQFLQQLRSDLARLRRVLTDPHQSQVIPVAVPEPMVVAETQRLVSQLCRHGMPTGPVVINRIAPPADCDLCSARHAAQQPALNELRAGLGAFGLVEVPLFPGEVQGLDALRRFERFLFRVPEVSAPGPGPGSSRPDAAPPSIPPARGTLAALLDLPLRLLIVGGKGGVGKTTIAAACAIRLARAGRKTLVLSTDPAHSLSDAFGCAVGSRAAPVPGVPDLCALELDASGALDDLRVPYREEIEAVFDRLVGGVGVDVRFDRRVMEELLSLTPPGLDEVMAFLSVMDLLDQDRYDRIVLDTAPSGHTLRFLEMPGVAEAWLRSFLKVLAKYQEVATLEKTIERVIALTRRVADLRRRLSNPDHTRFVAVTVPETLGVRETEDLLCRLNELKVPTGHLIANMVATPSQCRFCSAVWAQQARRLADLAAEHPGIDIVTVPRFPRALRGLDDLVTLAGVLFGN